MNKPARFAIIGDIGEGQVPPSWFFMTGSCETLCEIELCEQFKQSAQALELLHERKMWNEQKPFCLSEAS